MQLNNWTTFRLFRLALTRAQPKTLLTPANIPGCQCGMSFSSLHQLNGTLLQLGSSVVADKEQLETLCDGSSTLFYASFVV